MREKISKTLNLRTPHLCYMVDIDYFCVFSRNPQTVALDRTKDTPIITAPAPAPAADMRDPSDHQTGETRKTQVTREI